MIRDERTTSLVHFWAPPRAEDDLRQVQDALTAIERLVDDAHLAYLVGDQSFDPLPVPREQWLSGRLNVPSGGYINLNAGATADLAVTFSDKVGFGGKPLRESLVVILAIGGDIGSGIERELLLSVGDALHAWRGVWNPPMFGRRLAGQRVRTNPGRAGSAVSDTPFGLPLLFGGRMSEGVWAPPDLGWLNYWSANVAAWLGFPDPARDEEWLTLACRSEDTGACSVALTADPLNLDLPEHIGALQRAWARFERIGVRAPPLTAGLRRVADEPPAQS